MTRCTALIELERRFRHTIHDAREPYERLICLQRKLGQPPEGLLKQDPRLAAVGLVRAGPRTAHPDKVSAPGGHMLSDLISGVSL